MIAPVQQPQERARAESWQRGYLRLLPDIQRRAALTFRQLPPEARAEAVQEVTVHTMLAYRRLAQRGRTADAYPSVLTRYAVAHYRVGRRTASAMNCRDVMSPSARCRKHITVERLDPHYARDQVWQEILYDSFRGVYPKYYGGFHERYFTEMLYPTGDRPVRGTAW